MLLSHGLIRVAVNNLDENKLVVVRVERCTSIDQATPTQVAADARDWEQLRLPPLRGQTVISSDDGSGKPLIARTSSPEAENPKFLGKLSRIADAASPGSLYYYSSAGEWRRLPPEHSYY